MLAGTPYVSLPPRLGAIPSTITNASSTSPFNINMPPKANPGNVVLAIAGRAGGSQTFTWPAGWVQLFSLLVGTFQVAFAWKMLVGNEGTTIAVSSTVATSQLGQHATYTVLDAISAEAATATGTSATPNPPSLSPSWSNNLASLYFVYYALSASQAVSVYPIGFSDDRETGSTFGAAWRTPGAGETHLVSLDPSAFTVAGSATWMSATVAFKGRS